MNSIVGINALAQQQKRAKKEIQISDVKKFWGEKKSRSIDRSQDRGQKKKNLEDRSKIDRVRGRNVS